MNFYKHHIGDYDQATRHLSFIEDAAYSRLIRKYYAEEEPLPADIRRVQRLIGARTDEECEAVEIILNEFFYLENEYWRNKRCDEEIAKADERAEKNREIALAREAQKRARLEHDSCSSGDEETTVRADVVNESSENREPNQTPDSRLQTPEKEKKNKAAAVASLSLENLTTDGVQADVAEEFLAARKKQKAPLTERAWNGIKREAGKAGWPLNAVLEKALEKGWRSFEAEWVKNQPAPTGANSSSGPKWSFDGRGIK